MLVVHGMENIYPISKKIKKVFICANTGIYWGSLAILKC